MEGSRCTYLCVWPRKELLCRSCNEEDPLGWPPEISPGGSPAPCSLQQPHLCTALRDTGGPGQKKFCSLPWSEERGQKLAKQSLDSWTRRQNKTQNKWSARSLSYPEASNHSSQISQPGLGHLLRPKNGSCPGVVSLIGAGSGAMASAPASGLRVKCCPPRREPQQRGLLITVTRMIQACLEGPSAILAERMNSNCEVDQVQGPSSCPVSGSLLAS